MAGFQRWQARRDARVGVLMGGLSSEREISLHSGEAVLAALRRRGWDAVAVDVDEELPFRLRELGVEVAWIALHGRFGEDGCVQGLLELLRLPYTGSGPTASAVAMDKVLTKRVLAGSGVLLAEDAVLRVDAPPPGELGFPLVVKTPAGGSSIGTFLCHGPEDYARAVRACAAFGPRVLVERYLEGDELTVALLDGEPLPVVGIAPENPFFDLEAKYTKGRTRYLVPAPLEPGLARRVQRDAATVARVLGLRGIARADFILHGGEPCFLEVNTIPGMTATSLSPMAARAAGISFDELVERVLLGAGLELSVEAGPGAGGEHGS